MNHCSIENTLCSIATNEGKCPVSACIKKNETIHAVYKEGKRVWPEEDPVNHPSHYETGKFESIDVMVETQGVEAVQNFCICNAFKYIYRHRFKNGVEDIKKAIWYLNKYVELNEEETKQ